MYTRHHEVPMLGCRDTTVDSNYYNHVQVALKRLNRPVRFRIPKLKHLDLIIQRDAWIVVDKVLNDVPIIAWTDFSIEHREALHQPIKCKLRTWHAAAGLIRTRTLEAMEMLLGEELSHHPGGDEDTAAVIEFKPKTK